MQIPINSAIGSASHIPLIPKINGNVINDMTIKIIVRKNDKMADTLPLLSAVNIADENILIPINR